MAVQEAKAPESKTEKKGDVEIAKKQESWLTPFEEMEKRMEQLFSAGWMKPFRFEWPSRWEPTPEQLRFPKADLVDNGDRITVRIEVPGVKKDNIDVDLSENSVTVRATSKHREEKKTEKYYRMESGVGEFARTIPLPEEIDVENAKASLEDGVLELNLPKTAKTSAKRIKID